MSTLTQATRPGEFLITEVEGNLSRTNGVVAASQTILVGSLLGRITMGTATASAITGTGNGAVSGVGRTTRSKVGVYTVRCISATTNSARFEVIDPDGISLAQASTGVAYSGAIAFTVADGSTDFVVGDSFTITVAAGSGQYALYNPAATDGTQFFAGIAYDAVTTGAGQTAALGIVDFGAEVLRTSLNFGSLDAGQQTAVIAQMLARFIKVREALG